MKYLSSTPTQRADLAAEISCLQAAIRNLQFQKLDLGAELDDLHRRLSGLALRLHELMTWNVTPTTQLFANGDGI